MGKFDSVQSTKRHIKRIGELINVVIKELKKRGQDHDKSKLERPEVDIFNEGTPSLKVLTYGSKKYHEQMQKIQPALDHHYKVNRHHPEYFKNGIKDMNLIDLIEMICDWKAATERHEDGDLVKSLKINQKKFGYSDELQEIFKNTIKII